MAQFSHIKCGKGLVQSVPLKLIILTMGIDGELVSPSLMDFRLQTSAGELRKVDEGTDVSPVWFCPTCKSEVPAIEVILDCFGCGGKHPVSEMVTTIHTSPVKPECYQKYRREHEEEQLPEKPKTRLLVDLLKTIQVKL